MIINCLSEIKNAAEKNCPILVTTSCGVINCYIEVFDVNSNLMSINSNGTSFVLRCVKSILKSDNTYLVTHRAVLTGEHSIVSCLSSFTFEICWN